MEGWTEEAYCDGCHRHCSLGQPRCRYGEQQAAKWYEGRRAAEAAAPTCPGCHVGCSLANPNCGRCQTFLEQWMRGEHVTTRAEQMEKMRAARAGGGQPGPSGPAGPASEGEKGEGGARRAGQPGPGRGGRPGFGGPGFGGPNADPASKLTMMIPLGARLFEAASLPMAEGRFLGMLHTAMGDWIRYGVLEEKARMDAKNLYPMIDRLLAQGYLVREFDTLYITEAGVQAGAAFREHEAENNARLFEALADEELEAFAASWEKLLHSWGDMGGGRPR